MDRPRVCAAMPCRAAVAILDPANLERAQRTASEAGGSACSSRRMWSMADRLNSAIFNCPEAVWANRCRAQQRGHSQPFETAP